MKAKRRPEEEREGAERGRKAEESFESGADAFGGRRWLIVVDTIKRSKELSNEK